MRKIVSALFLTAMILSLTACGSTAPTQTETPAPTAAVQPTAEPTAEATAAPAAEYPVLVNCGDSVSADLDGDGTPEEICLLLEDDEYGGKRCRLTINGEDFTEILRSGDTYVDSPDDGYYAITDVDSGDGLLELAVQDWGPSDDLCTWFFRYDGSKLTSLGSVAGLIQDSGEKGDVAFDGKGTVSSFVRLAVLQTWWADADWRIDGTTGKFAVVPQELYTGRTQTPVTVKTDILAYAAMGDAASDRTLTAGTALTVTGTDNAHWVRCTEGSGGEVWLYLFDENSSQLETPDGGAVSCWDALDGLNMAD